MKVKLFAALFSMLMVVSVQAQHPAKHPAAKKHAVQHQKAAMAKNHEMNMAHAYKAMKRTNKAIALAHGAVKKGKNYTGDLSKAIHHQRYAKHLLKNGKANRAILHTRVARKHAFLAIRANKSTYDRTLEFNDEETKLIGESVGDDELEKEMKQQNPNADFDDSKITDKDLSETEVLETDPADYKNE
ncbi:MAG: hypothetical protein KDD41_05035 [Flavobacteriales bacterium]|nr:hypothetical protein [Flavobacteriales bacterium]